MTDIEKMFDNAGIKPKRSKEYTFDTTEDFKIHEHIVCFGYPDFTAEKQLGLIKWLASKQYAKYDEPDKDFENALAGIINEMWQDLTDQEKEEIKDILKWKQLKK